MNTKVVRCNDYAILEFDSQHGCACHDRLLGVSVWTSGLKVGRVVVAIYIIARLPNVNNQLQRVMQTVRLTRPQACGRWFILGVAGWKFGDGK